MKPGIFELNGRQSLRPVFGYDLDANRVLIPEHVQKIGKVEMAGSDVTLAAQQALYIPPGGTAQANTAGLDGTINKTLSLTVQPSLATGSVTLRDIWVVAMN